MKSRIVIVIRLERSELIISLLFYTDNYLASQYIQRVGVGSCVGLESCVDVGNCVCVGKCVCVESCFSVECCVGVDSYMSVVSCIDVECLSV